LSEPSIPSTQQELLSPFDALEGMKDDREGLTPVRDCKEDDKKKGEKEESNGGVRHLQLELEAETVGEAVAGAGAGVNEGVATSTYSMPRVCLSDHAAFLSHMMNCSLKMHDGKGLLRNLPLSFANKLPNGFQMSTIEVQYLNCVLSAPT
jgi:hypothetical protein